MPSVVSDRAAVWAGVGKTPPPPAAAAAAAFGGEDAAGRGGAAKSISGSGPFGDDYLAKMMEGLNVSEHDKTKLINDVTVQRISGLRILSLSLSLMSGHVHPLGRGSSGAALWIGHAPVPAGEGTAQGGGRVAGRPAQGQEQAPCRTAFYTLGEGVQ